jgi:cyclase
MEQTMKQAMIVVAVLLVMSISLPAAGEEPIYKTTKLTDRIYELSADGGGYPETVIASVGDDGLLIVDSGAKEKGKALVDALMALGKGLPKVIINTHSHIEHIGGNVAIGPGRTIIGHANLRDRYINGLYVFNGVPDSVLPNVTFTDSLSVFFNGEEIKLIAFPGAHDNSDIIAWFTGSKVVCTGAVCVGHHFPSIDGELGDITKYPGIVAKAISILPEDVRIVPAHGDDCTMKELREFHDMLVQTSGIIRSELAKGKTIEQMQDEHILANWKPWELYVTCDGWIRYWVQGVQHPHVVSTKTKVYAPVYHAFVDKGVDAAIAVYQDLKKNQSDRYEFEERTPMWIGRRFANMGNSDGAIKFLNLCITEYPNTDASAISEASIGNVYWRQGKKDEAKPYYLKYLQRFPRDKAIQERVKGESGK